MNTPTCLHSAVMETREAESPAQHARRVAKFVTLAMALPCWCYAAWEIQPWNRSEALPFFLVLTVAGALLCLPIYGLVWAMVTLLGTARNRLKPWLGYPVHKGAAAGISSAAIAAAEPVQRVWETGNAVKAALVLAAFGGVGVWCDSSSQDPPPSQTPPQAAPSNVQERGRLMVRSTPPGADIFIQGEATGAVTPAVVGVPLHEQVAVRVTAGRLEGWAHVSVRSAASEEQLLLVLTPAVGKEMALDRARQALMEGSLEHAVEEARRVGDGEDQREALEILAAVYDAVKDDAHAKETYRQLKALGNGGPAPTARAAPPGTPEPPAGVAVDQDAFVQATRLKLRLTASASSPAEGGLRLNDAVHVISIQPGWAKVATRDDPPKSGFVNIAYLGAAPGTSAGFAERAQPHEARGDWDLATAELERAVSLDPADDVLRGRLRKAAVLARQYQVAVGAVLAPGAAAVEEIVPPTAQNPVCLQFFESLGEAHGQQFGWFITLLGSGPADWTGYIRMVDGDSALIEDLDVEDATVTFTFFLADALNPKDPIAGAFRGELRDGKLSGKSVSPKTGKSMVMNFKRQDDCGFDAKNISGLLAERKVTVVWPAGLPEDARRAILEKVPDFAPWQVQEYPLSFRPEGTALFFLTVDANKDGKSDYILDGHDPRQSVLVAVISSAGGRAVQVIHEEPGDQHSYESWVDGKKETGLLRRLFRAGDQAFSVMHPQQMAEDGSSRVDPWAVDYVFEHGEFQERRPAE